MVEKEELGKPPERLKEKMAKLQLLTTSTETDTNSGMGNEGRDTMLEQMLVMAEERVSRLGQ